MFTSIEASCFNLKFLSIEAISTLDFPPWIPNAINWPSGEILHSLTGMTWPFVSDFWQT